MLGGEPPHTASTPKAILARQMSGEVRSLRPLRSTVSPRLDKTIRRALAPAPADRYRSMPDFVEALASGMRESAAQDRPKASRRTVLARIVTGVAIAAAALVTWLVLRPRAPAAAPDERLGVAVFPFRAESPAVAEWSEQIPDLLATVLDGTPQIRVADPWSLWRGLRPKGDARAAGPRDPSDARRLATQAAADRFVMGTVAPDGERMRLNVRVYRAGEGEPLRSLLFEATVIKSWVQFTSGQPYQGLMPLAERAVALKDSLSDRNRLRAEAMLAAIRTDGPAAAAATRGIIELDSTDLEGWDHLAYLNTELGWQYGATPEDALAAAEHAVRLDPSHIPALLRRAWLSVSLGDANDVRAQAVRLARADTTRPLIRSTLRGLHAVVATDAQCTALVDTLAPLPFAEWLAAHRFLRYRAPSRDRQLLNRVRSLGPGISQRAAVGELARLDIAEGRLLGPGWWGNGGLAERGGGRRTTDGWGGSRPPAMISCPCRARPGAPLPPRNRRSSSW